MLIKLIFYEVEEEIKEEDEFSSIKINLFSLSLPLFPPLFLN